MLKKRVAEISLMNLDGCPGTRSALGRSCTSGKAAASPLVYRLVMPEEADADGRADLAEFARSAGRCSTGSRATRSPSGRPAATGSFEIVKLVTIFDEV